MPSCSRIARRCGERDASTSGGAGGTLTPAYGRATGSSAGHFRAHSGGDELVVGVILRAFWGAQLV